MLQKRLHFESGSLVCAEVVDNDKNTPLTLARQALADEKAKQAEGRVASLDMQVDVPLASFSRFVFKNYDVLD